MLRSLMQKTTYYMILFMNNALKSHICEDRKQIRDFLGLRVSIKVDDKLSQGIYLGEIA